MAPVRVLVVDDEKPILALFHQMLSLCGAAVDVTDGPGALRVLDEREFDLVISDMQMPGTDGLEVLAAARRGSPKAIRVLMSGDGSALLRGKGVDSPAHVLLPKPVGIGQLRELLRGVATATPRLEAILESMRRRYPDSPDAIFVKDLQGRYLYMNATGAALLPRPVSEPAGRLDSEIFDRPTLLEEVRASDQEVLRTCRHYLYVNATRVPGTARTFLSAKFPVRDESGAIVAIGCLSRDVTEFMAPSPRDLSRRLDDLLGDLREISSILESGAAVERSEIERLLQNPTGIEERIGVAKGDDPPNR